MDKRSLYILVVLFLFAVLIRSLALDYVISDEEAPIASDIKTLALERKLTITSIVSPIYKIVFALPSFFLEFNNTSLRLMPLLFGLATILIIYLIAIELFNKRTALLSVFLTSILFYHIWASVQLDIDGGILTFFVSLTLLFYLKHVKYKKKKWIILTGLFLGISTLVKYPAALIAAIIFLFELACNRLKDKKNLIFIYLIGLMTFLIYPLILIISNSGNIFSSSLGSGGHYLSSQIVTNFKSVLISIIKHAQHLIKHGTPVFLFAPILAYFYKKDKKELILFLWIIIFLIYYVFIQAMGNGYKYLTIIIPPVIILTSNLFVNIIKKVDKKRIFVMIAFTIVFFGIIFLLNINSSNERVTQSNFGLNFLSINPQLWMGDVGPIFQISIFSFLFVSFSGFIFFMGSLFGILKNNRKKIKIFLVLLISVSLAYNLFLINELYNPLFSPDANKAVNELVVYYKENDFPEPLYFPSKNIPFYLDYKSKYNLKNENIKQIVSEKGGTILIINTPPEWQEGKTFVEHNLKNCDVDKIFKYKDYETGYIYVCNKI